MYITHQRCNYHISNTERAYLFCIQCFTRLNYSRIKKWELLCWFVMHRLPSINIKSWYIYGTLFVNINHTHCGFLVQNITRGKHANWLVTITETHTSYYVPQSDGQTARLFLFACSSLHIQARHGRQIATNSNYYTWIDVPKFNLF